ncbi:MAG: POT family MFS transporter [Sedimentisphaerales bacterium]
MAKNKYLTAPVTSKKMPSGMPYILTNEATERFAFYGMTSILMVFMTKYLMGPNGVLSVMADETATAWFHWFTAAVYVMAIVGALISDAWLGKFKTIILFSIVYCVGYFVLAWDHTRMGLTAGLVLIAIGSGIIKPCVSANVGDQFGPSNKHLIERFYGWFYFSINLGAAVSMFLCPLLLDKYGPMVGFGVPAIFMVVALLAYWVGRNRLVHIPPSGKIDWFKTVDREGAVTLGKLCIIFVYVAMFFALFYQSQSSWVLQAQNMKLRWLWINWRPAQMQAANPFLVMILIPAFSYFIYPALNRLWTMTPLRRIGIGMFLTAGSFLVPIWIETQIANGGQPSIGWQFFAYIFLTGAEVMVSVTALEFAYTQAPNKMKSLVQSINLLSIALGNIFSAVVNQVIRNPDGTSKLPGASYYWFFMIAMVVTSVLFIPVARWYKQKEYIQDEIPAESSA